MGGLTCVTCQVAFTDPGLHRIHFKGDWHRYNLKRKVANLSTVSAQDFEARKASHEPKGEAVETKEISSYCIACRKNFSNNKAYENHVNSKKHKDMVLKAGPDQLNVVKENAKNAMQSKVEEEEDEDVEMEEVDSDEWEDYEEDPLHVSDCLFCPKQSNNMDNNVRHMTEAHSFFFPDPEYLVDLHGLLEYLGAKVGQGMMCLWCSDKSKQYTSVQSVQKHMVDKGHCKLKHEGEALIEYSDFYDYSSSYPEGEEGEPQDMEVKLDELDDSGFQMTLPSGATVGHRSLVRYYRQSLNPNRELILAKAAKDKSGGKTLLSTYRALGWSGSSKQEVAKKVRDIKFMNRQMNKHYMKRGRQNNDLMRHFHDRNEGLQ
eukprot:TRINITY_DN2017_c0_g2_i1.p1 TRINITY_DN2017_c0_g2~~TRINITY_DN2017_c0_g2_i1.p1  ORF type:complete len:374 (-),score=116.40 TRINITY_DN2017_c0_g2_i1:479-1600(-)